jgi:hypothetical protein
VEGLSLYHEVVAIANLLLNLLNFIAWESRYDTVYEGSVNAASLLEPFLEVFAQVPKLDILIDAILQHVSVQEDQLTWEDDQTLGLVAVECLIATIEQLYQLAGIRRSRGILQFAGRIEGDTSLSGVRNHEADFGLIGQCHESSVLCVRIQCATNHVDTLQGVYGLTVLAALQVYVVKAILGVEPVYHTSFDRLYDYYATVKIGLLVHIPDNPIYECTEEITLTELNHLFRHHALWSELFV